jgi:hypothetical protein
MGWRQTHCPLGLQKRQKRLSWLCKTGIDSNHFHFIGFVLVYLETASLYRWRPCADVNCEIVLSTNQIAEKENIGN